VSFPPFPLDSPKQGTQLTPDRNSGTNYIGGTGDTQSDAAWLVPICLQIAPAVILFVGMIFMPFSPRWLIHHGREDEARKVLSNLRGLPEDHELVELEFLEIKAQSLFEKRTVAELFPSLREQTAWNTFKLQFVAIGKLFQTKAMFKRVCVATVTMFFQQVRNIYLSPFPLQLGITPANQTLFPPSQWTGINAVLYYAPSIFKQLGLSDNTVSLLATGVVGIVMWIATMPAVLWIDRLGRKPVLTIGAIGMATCHIIIAVIVAKNIDQWSSQKAAGWAAVVMVWLFVIHFGYSWGPCAWIIVAEIWPLSTRPYGVSLGASSNWMNNFIVGQVTPDMLSGITYGTYILFGLLTYLGAAFIWFFVPETKRLTLEEMVSDTTHRGGCRPWNCIRIWTLTVPIQNRTSSSAPRALPRPTSSAWRRSTPRSVSPSSSVARVPSPTPRLRSPGSVRPPRRCKRSRSRIGYRYP
jgi:hypothetical protein